MTTITRTDVLEVAYEAAAHAARAHRARATWEATSSPFGATHWAPVSVQAAREAAHRARTILRVLNGDLAVDALEVRMFAPGLARVLATTA